MARYSFWVVFEHSYYTLRSNNATKKYVVLARVPHLLGTVAAKPSLKGARKDIKDAMQGMIASMLKGGDVVKSDLQNRKPQCKKAVAIEYITVDVKKPAKKKPTRAKAPR